MELQAEKSWETGEQVAFLVPPPAHQPWQQPQTTRAPRRALLAQRAPPPLLVVPDVGIGGGGQGSSLARGGPGPLPQPRATPPGQTHMRGAAAGPAAASGAPSRLRPERGRKANKDVLVSALLEAQEGGNQCLVNGKRENRSGKTVYFQAGEGFVNSTGHCGGSIAGHKLPRGGERRQAP